jgi:transposase
MYVKFDSVHISFRMNFMSDPESFISDSENVGEVERAASVRMIEEGLKGVTVCKVLIISDTSVRNRKKVYKNKGAEGLRSGYEGSKGYLSKSRKDEIIKYPGKQEHPSVEESRDYIEKNCGILYESEQSYCDLPDVRRVKPAQKSEEKS